MKITSKSSQKSTQVLIAYIYCGTLVSSFNIDTQYPFVIKNEFNGPSAHFGVTVTLIPAANELHKPATRQSLPTGWVFIGAPKGNSTHAIHKNINEPGVIWRCALGSSPTPTDCVIMQIDPTGEYDPKNINWAHKDRKDGAWIGGSMSAVGDRFVTCGSRWINQKYGNDYWMNGICYWVPKSNVIANDINENWPWLPPKFSYRLSAFLKKSRQVLVVPQPKPQDKANSTNAEYRYDWYLGQLGFSIAIADNHKEMIVGAPGVYEWTGTVVQFRDSVNETTEIHRRFNAHPSSSVFSEVLVARVRQYDEDTQYLDNDNYFGYAVATGNFFYPSISQNRTQYVGGAPRSKSLLGRVLVFSFRDTAEPQTAVLDHLVAPIELLERHLGAYASYFGASLLALDINNDQFDDIIIGAPQYSLPESQTRSNFKKTEDHGSTSTAEGDEGCVFIFLSDGHDFGRAPQELCGYYPGGRFGTSIASIGDINSDGYNDFAVGSPYENDNRGAVYIYFGGEKARFAQKLQSKAVDPHARTFGYSISSADIDSNGYPDVAVGAFESNHVFVFRSIPVVNFDSRLSLTVPKILPATHEFTVTSCISFSGKSLPDALWLNVKLEIFNPLKPGSNNATDKLLTWVAIETPILPDISNLVHPLTTQNHLLYFRRSGTCYNFTALKIGKLNDVSRKVVIRKTFSINTPKASEEIEPIFYDIIKDNDGKPSLNLTNVKASSFEKFQEKSALPVADGPHEVEFVLPVGTVCETDEDPNPTCRAHLYIKSKFQDYEGNILSESQPFILGASEYIIVTFELWNVLELAKLPARIYVQWTSSIPHNCLNLKIRQTSSNCEKYPGDTKDKYWCNATRAIHQGQMEYFEFHFHVSGLYAGEVCNHIKFLAKATTVSDLVEIPKITFDLPLQYNMRFTDYSSSQDLTSNFQTDFFNFSQVVEINLVGNTPIYVARLEMDFPKYIEIDGQTVEFALYRPPLVIYANSFSECTAVNGSFVEDIISKQQNSVIPSKSNFFMGWTPEGDGDDDFEADFFKEEYNPDGMDDIMVQSRYKRSVHAMDSFAQFPKFLGFERKYVDLKLACGENGVQCMRVVCDMKYFHSPSKGDIEFKIRIRSEVLRKILQSKAEHEVKFLWFESKGQLKMMNKSGLQFGNVAEVAVVTKIELPEVSHIPLWIIMLAVTCGLLILTVITVTLVKCGFFRRQRGNATVEILACTDKEEPSEQLD